MKCIFSAFLHRPLCLRVYENHENKRKIYKIFNTFPLSIPSLKKYNYSGNSERTNSDICFYTWIRNSRMRLINIINHVYTQTHK